MRSARGFLLGSHLCVMPTTGCLPNVAGMTTVVSTTLASVKWRSASLLKGNVAEELARLVPSVQTGIIVDLGARAWWAARTARTRPSGAGEATHPR